MKKIIYLANYQENALWDRRRIAINRSLAGSRKIDLISKGLSSAGIDVTILSAGKTGRSSLVFWKSFLLSLGPQRRVLYAPFWECGLIGHLLSAFWQIWHVALLLSKGRAVIVYNITVESLAALLMAALLRRQAIIEYEDAVTEVRGGARNLLGMIKKSLRAAEYLVGNIVQGAVVPSGLLAQRIVSDNTLVIPTLGDFEGLSWNDTQDYLFYGGALEESKGVHQLMEALDSVDIPVVITGAGPLESTVRTWAERDSKRRFLGAVAREEFDRLASQAFLCINPHVVGKHHGGLWPFKVVEMMALCGALITTPCEGAPPELLTRAFVARNDSPTELRRYVLDIFRRGVDPAFRESNRRWARHCYDFRTATKPLASLLGARDLEEALSI